MAGGFHFEVRPHLLVRCRRRLQPRRDAYGRIAAAARAERDPRHVHARRDLGRPAARREIGRFDSRRSAEEREHRSGGDRRASPVLGCVGSCACKSLRDLHLLFIRQAEEGV